MEAVKLKPPKKYLGNNKLMLSAFLKDISKEQWEKHFSTILRRWRTDRRFSQAKFASLLGVHRQCIANWEAKVNTPPLYLLYSLQYLDTKFPVL